MAAERFNPDQASGAYHIQYRAAEETFHGVLLPDQVVSYAPSWMRGDEPDANGDE